MKRLGLILSLLASTCMYPMDKYSDRQRNSIILDYDDTRHKDDLKKLIEENKSLLFARPDYCIDTMLKLKTVTPHIEESRGKLKIKVIYEDCVDNRSKCDLEAFIAYSFADQSIVDGHLLAVKQACRRKGYAKRLIWAAIDDGLLHNASRWRASTRKMNTGAPELYAWIGAWYKKNYPSMIFKSEETKVPLSHDPLATIDIIRYELILPTQENKQEDPK